MRGLWRLQAQWRRLRERALLAVAERAVARFPATRVRRPHGLGRPLVVSLTSYPPRFATLAKTLKSLLDQDIAADRTVLWLGHGDAAALPDDVRALEHQGLEIRACEDMGPYTKLIPALGAFPDACIVTADDDIYYRPNWLAGLVATARAHPRAIVAHRCHLALRHPDGTFRSYADWRWGTPKRADTAQGALFPTGVGGVLYPPGAFDHRVLDTAAFKALCPRADDVWFFWLARLAGTSQRGLGRPAALIAWHGSQEVGLMHQNWIGGNNSQIAAMERHYGPLAPMA